jgi:serine O-acetyltransferase
MFSELIKIKQDARAILGGTLDQKPPPYKLTWMLYRLISYEFIVVFSFRFISQLYQVRYLKPLSLVLYFMHKLLFKVDIHPSASIGQGLQLVHGFSIVIGANSSIGCNVAIFDGVSLGKKNVGHQDGMPTIGDDVILGSGAKILGDVNIANGSMVGANAVVLSSFVSINSIIVGIPARCVN